jgi:DNA-binding response OmpR family regulator
MRIAVVEDDRQLRGAIARGLREAGWTVDEAADGEAALALVTDGSHDVVLLDVLLPGLDGRAVCQALRHRGVRTPVLMLTALGAVGDRIAGLDAGADDYLAKPFDFGELLARLRALTRRHGAAPDAAVRIGPFRVDPARRAVRRGDVAIPLTPKEFALLWYLVRHAGRVVGRAELLQQVWDGGGGAYSNLIDVYASRLRRKLEVPGAPPLVQTIRGSGFLVEALPEPAP